MIWPAHKFEGVGVVLRDAAGSSDQRSGLPPIAANWHREHTEDLLQRHTLLHFFRISAENKSVNRSLPMLHYAVVFFVIALIAALFGFGGIASSAVGIAKILFVIFVVLAVASFLFGLISKK